MYQIEPPEIPKSLLPTMFDLPSEDPEEPGLPDIFHLVQPRLLEYSFRPPHYSKDQMFIGSDVNIYYNYKHPDWYKRPDWYVVLGVQRLYAGSILRSSYVIWQEEVSPFIVVELLSPGTEDEDLGTKLRDAEKPPGKWEVYERILKVPYYVVFDGKTCEFRVFKLKKKGYVEAKISNQRIWIPELEIGLGVYQGSFDDTVRPWLRWYDAGGNWILTKEELQTQRAELEKQRAELEKQRADSEKQRADSEKQRAELEKQRAELEKRKNEVMAAKLRELGIDPDSIINSI
jgi:Uma2 family endonuclease